MNCLMLSIQRHRAILFEAFCVHVLDGILQSITAYVYYMSVHTHMDRH